MGQRTQLVNYGIHTEQSDWRVHVCVLARRVYVFPPPAAVQAVNRRAVKDQAGNKQVFTGDVMTATGYAIPVAEIDPIYEILIPKALLGHDHRSNAPFIIHHDMDTSVKGRRAEALVKWMWLHNMFPFMRPLSIQEQREKKDQIKGMDLKLIGPNLEVKCDFAGGVGNGATGNLFIQLSECNPFGRH